MLWRAFDHANLAATLLSGGRYEAAKTACAIGIECSPNAAELYVLLARALDGLGSPDEALAACACALERSPTGPIARDAYITGALIYSSAGDRERAFWSAQRAWEVAPDDRDVHTLLGNLLSWHGDLESALPHVEWHWTREAEYCEDRFGDRAAWDGSDLTGQRMLVVHQQGYGDQLQMARYLPLLRDRALRVTVECLPPVAGVLRSISGIDVVSPQSVSDDAFDRYVRMMRLPRLLGVDAGAAVPYLQADDALVALWRARLCDATALRVGIAWAGSAQHVLDFERSMLPQTLEPLAALRGVRFYSLMMEPEWIGASVPGLELLPLGQDFRDFSDAAATLAQLDLVLTVDTAFAHLAGALGVPVWLMLPRRPDWRWAGNGERTSWYPSMRLFRETAPRWETVPQRVAAELAKLAG